MRVGDRCKIFIKSNTFSGGYWSFSIWNITAIDIMSGLVEVNKIVQGIAKTKILKEKDILILSE